MATKPIHLLQEYHCTGSCKAELYDGVDCHHGTCEYNIHDPVNKEQKEELCQLQQEAIQQAMQAAAMLPPTQRPTSPPDISLLPTEPVRHIVTMRPAMYPTHRPRSSGRTRQVQPNKRKK